MDAFLLGFADELVKMSATKAVVPMPPVTGGRPEYKADGSFKPKMPKIKHPGAMKTAKPNYMMPKKGPQPTLEQLASPEWHFKKMDTQFGWKKGTTAKAVRGRRFNRADKNLAPPPKPSPPRPAPVKPSPGKWRRSPSGAWGWSP